LKQLDCPFLSKKLILISGIVDYSVLDYNKFLISHRFLFEALNFIFKIP